PLKHRSIVTISERNRSGMRAPLLAERPMAGAPLVCLHCAQSAQSVEVCQYLLAAERMVAGQRQRFLYCLALCREVAVFIHGQAKPLDDRIGYVRLSPID